MTECNCISAVHLWFAKKQLVREQHIFMKTTKILYGLSKIRKHSIVCKNSHALLFKLHLFLTLYHLLTLFNVSHIHFLLSFHWHFSIIPPIIQLIGRNYFFRDADKRKKQISRSILHEASKFKTMSLIYSST